jgi:hypothetical protein
MSISCDLIAPELFAGFWPFKKAAVMTVPEAPVHKYDRFVLWKRQVGSAGQFPVVQPETETAGMEPAAYDHFRFGVCAPDRGHIAAAGGCVMNVSQPC